MAHKEYTVRQGDCISSIAYKHGFFPDTIWNDSKNSSLKQKRKDPNVLLPGDVVHIRDMEQKEESCPSEQRHRFRKKGVPAKMKVQMLLNDEPRKNEKYRLYVDDVLLKEGKTDSNGIVEETIPPNAMKGEIVFVDENGNEERYPFDFGTVDPIDTDEGIKGRLLNLGYSVDDLPTAVREFQQKEGLEATGNINEATRNKIKEKFGE